MNQKITIKDLSGRREYIPLVSKWAWKQWSRSKGTSLKEVIYRTEHCLTNKCPRTFIAFYGSKPVGTASLWPTDYRIRLDLSPWFTDLYILPRYRNHGIGQALQVAVLKGAKKNGFKKIYLMTDLKGYYEKIGWRFIGTGPYMKTRKTRVYEYSW